MKNKVCLKIISIILILSLIMQNIPVVISATSIENDENSEEKAIYALYEEDALREENTKHFRMSDGSYTAVSYTAPIHYLAEDGKYVDIDNTLQKTDKGYKTANNPFCVVLPQESDGEVSIENNQKKISFKLQDSKKVKTKIKENKQKTKEEIEKEAKKAKTEKEKANIINNDKYTLKNYSSGVVYEEAFEGTDISYDINGLVLKESIVLNEKNAKSSYTYAFTYTGFSAVLNTDNSVSFMDGEQECFKLAAPYMFDAAKAYSSDIEVKLAITETGCIYELIPNKDWLKDKQRIYPITIDPTVAPELSATDIKDATTVFANYSSSLENWAKNYPHNETNSFPGAQAYDFLAIGRYSPNDVEVGCCIYAAIPEKIPDTARIINASLNIASAYFTNNVYSINNVRLDAYMITSDWNTGDINEESILFSVPKAGGYAIPSRESKAIDYRYLSEGVNNYHDIDITKAAQYWHNGGNNYGIMLKMDEYSLSSNCLVAFYASDFKIGGVTNRPVFVYTYRDTVGLEDYWSYHSISTGNAGTGYINDFNGNLTFIHNDTNYVNERYNISLSHVYNSNNLSKNIGYGNGWRLNIWEYGKENNNYYFVDGDGTKHYFYNDDGTYKDEDGLGCVLSFVSGDYPNKITTKSYETLLFDSNGKLHSISDSNSNTVEFSYGADGLTAIKAGDTDVIKLNYEGGKLSCVLNEQTGRRTNYTYDSAGNLITITQIFDSSTDETYNYTYSGKLLTSATDSVGYRITYDYISADTINRVKSVSESVVDSNNQRRNGQVMTFSYKNGNQTVVEDCGLDGDILITSDNNKMTYQFDVYGQLVLVYDEDGKGANYKFSDIDNQQHNLTLSSASYGYIPGGTFIKDSDFYYNNAFWNYSGSVEFINSAYATLVNGAQIYQTLTLDKGKYKASANYSVLTDEAKGRIRIIFQNNETLVSSYTQTYNYYTDELEFEIVNNDTQITVIFEECGNGTVQIDSPTLYKMPRSSKINYVTDGNFEYEKADYESFGEWNTSLAAFGANFPVKEEYDGNMGKVLEILPSCAPTSDMYSEVYCNPYVSGKAGEVLLLSGWAKATAINDDSCTFALELKITHKDGTTDTKRMDFNNNITDWQFGSLAVPVQKDYNSVTVTVDYCYQLNAGYFDDIQLIKDNATSYVYDENGNVISAKTSATNEKYEYDGNSRLTSAIDTTGRNFKYNYDDKNNLISSVSDAATTIRYTYNGYGQATFSETFANTQYEMPKDNGSYYIFLRSTGLYLNLGYTAVNDRFNPTINTQKFYLEKQSDSYFTIYTINETSKRYLAVNNASDTYTICSVAEDDGNSTRFKFDRDKNGGYRIIPKVKSDFCIDNATGTTSNATALTVSAIEKQNSNQVWYLESAAFRETAPVIKENCVYAIRNFNSGAYFAPEENTVGSELVSGKGDYSSGKYYLEKYGETEYYYIRISGSDLVLSLNETQDGIVVEEYYADDDYQLFSITVNSSDPVGYNIYSISINPKLAPTKYLLEIAENIMFGEMPGHWRSYWFFEELLYSSSSATYTTDCTKLSTTTDTATGAFSKYFYDDKGRVKRVLTNKGITNNEYDAKDRVTKISSGNSNVGYIYNNKNQLVGINVPTGNNTLSYEFYYDAFGNNTKITAGNNILSQYSYIGNTRLMSAMTYGNNDNIAYTYDNDYRITKKVYTDKNTQGDIVGSYAVNYEYDIFGNVYKLTDGFTGVTTRYNYDLLGRISSIRKSDGINRTVAYDAFDRVNGFTVSVFNKNINSAVNYDEFGQVNSFVNTIGDRTDTINYIYDAFYRKTGRTIAGINNESSYTYLKGAGGQDTVLVSSFNNGKNTYSYTYDSVGNITSIAKDGTVLESYTYDNLNQLTKITKGTDVYVYTYDYTGNLQSVKKNGTVIQSYSYTDSNRCDLLTAYNGTNIPYDEIGNPLNWRNGMSLGWSYGRRLTSVTDDNNSISYTYDSEGLRTSKTVNGVKTEYYWSDGILQGQRTGNEYIIFLYDENGVAYGLLINSNGTESYYYYLYNLQGDIVGIMDNTGTTVTEYTYDAWGKLLSTTGNTELGNKNPLRYRGYYYDNETELYYVSSRYYDPEVCRFISSDTTDILTATPMALTDKNLFAYCDNNPVVRIDSRGEFWDILFDIYSFAVSLYEVITNPCDADAWIGLALDTVDFVPFLSGLGESYKTVNATTKIVNKTIDATNDSRKVTGSYEIIYKSGMTYVGKGGYKRALNSANRYVKKNSDEVVSLIWKSAPNNRIAMINEYKSMCKFGGPNNSLIRNKNSYNKIWSPGRKYYLQDYGTYYYYGGRNW